MSNGIRRYKVQGFPSMCSRPRGGACDTTPKAFVLSFPELSPATANIDHPGRRSQGPEVYHTILGSRMCSPTWPRSRTVSVDTKVNDLPPTCQSSRTVTVDAKCKACSSMCSRPRRGHSVQTPRMLYRSSPELSPARANMEHRARSSQDLEAYHTILDSNNPLNVFKASKCITRYKSQGLCPRGVQDLEL